MTKEHSLRKLFLGTALASTLFAGTSCSSTKKLTNDSELLKQKIEQIDYNEDYQLLPEQYAVITSYSIHYTKLYDLLSFIYNPYIICKEYIINAIVSHAHFRPN